MSNRLALLALIAVGSANAQNVPVSKVVLFSSGVGYFEHAGLVHGTSSTELRFKTAQINDILKSLVLQDQDGGRVGAITYPSQDPLAKTLRSFQVDITSNPSLAQLLNQLRGAKVSVQAQGERIAGTILGVESRRRMTEKGESIDAPLLNLLAGASIRAIELQSIASLSLEDPQLQEELAKALSALVQARDQDKKPVTINFNGTGDRRVRIGYVVETPVWKTSYRLVLDDKNATAKLQGWAIVENQTESDWNGVSLDLVSGRPISFTMDLYQPLYAKRPNVVPEMFANLRPQVYAGGLSADTARVALRAPAAAPAPAAQRRLGEGTLQLQEVVVTSAANAHIDVTSSVDAVAAGSRLGELFHYSVPNVTLARQKSAMLPIITDSVCVERVSIYNMNVLGTNPLNGVWFQNTTGKSLLQGPLTVLENGGYAGDARIDDVPTGQSRLLSYGMDLEMTVNAGRRDPRSSYTAASIQKGVLVLRRKLTSSIEYAAENKSAKEKTLVIEHPRQESWRLVDTQKPFETTATTYRFKGVAPPHKITTLVVTEEFVTNDNIGILGIDLGQLILYNRNGEIPARVRDALNEVIRMRQGVADVDRQIGVLAQQVRDITAEQGRIRENMRTVGTSGEYYQRLLAKLNEQESTIEKGQAERERLVSQREQLQRELEEHVSKLAID